MPNQQNQLIDKIMLHVLSVIFTFAIYYVIKTYSSIHLTSFPGLILGIYLGMALIVFPQVTPTDYEHGQFVTSKVLFPLYYLFSPIIFIHHLLTKGKY